MPLVNTYYAPGPRVWVTYSNSTHIHWGIYLPDPAVSMSHVLTHLPLPSLYRCGN